MRSVRLLLAGCVIGVMVLTTSFEGQERTITIHVGTLLDGRCGAQRNTNIVVQGSKILKLDPGLTTYDLRTLTILPGIIDVHFHINGHFGKDGRVDNRGETPAQEALLPGRKCLRHADGRLHDRSVWRASRCRFARGDRTRNSGGAAHSDLRPADQRKQWRT